MIDPSYDLEGFIRESNDNGSAEADPYSYAVSIIKTTLEWALDDGISGSMSESEYSTLEKLAIVLTHEDPHISIEPRIG